MTIDIARELLGWCSVINVGLLSLWFLFFILSHYFMFRLHGKIFYMSGEKFVFINYAGMAIFKINILIFNVVPYLALLIVT
jgi:hypothetical protein